MWPFKKKQPEVDSSNAPIGYSQLDITDNFHDDKKLSKEEWVTTTPLNTSVPDPESSGLPSREATKDEIHAIATKMSMARDNMALANDGVYCPACNIASADLSKLHQPCPKCHRPLLRFGRD